ncbi:hypothetical protein ACTMTI_36300 [Nonomuraea sp. H19]|uniref:hypothetical protein n=1 Tax=Nonomuraea sp. H19 TaxID=3452206 RepID=UPI003F896FBC
MEYVQTHQPQVVKKRVQVKHPQRLRLDGLRERIRRAVYSRMLKHLVGRPPPDAATVLDRLHTPKGPPSGR